MTKEKFESQVLLVGEIIKLQTNRENLGIFSIFSKGHKTGTTSFIKPWLVSNGNSCLLLIWQAAISHQRCLTKFRGFVILEKTSLTVEPNKLKEYTMAL